jgi:CBS domain-containing membrane protein
MPSLLHRLRRYFPPAPELSAREQLRSALGTLIGVAIAGLLGTSVIGNGHALPWLIAPMGASAVLLFALPASPLAQPWSVFGGNVVSALIGIACSRWIDPPLLAGAVAVGAAVLVMFGLRCLHPPGGAMALLTALGAPGALKYGYEFALTPVALNTIVMLAAAVAYNRLCGRRYPHVAVHHGNTHRTAYPQPSGRVGVAPEDLDAVLKDYNELLDISRDDLEEIVRRTEMHAYHRHFGKILCADVMSKDVVKVEFGTELKPAWRLLHEHRIKALPVVNRFQRVIGIVTQHDFLKAAEPGPDAALPQKLWRLLAKTPGPYSDKPEVVGQIMTRRVRTVQANTPIAGLVPLFSDGGLHHVPVVDANQRLVGMLTQSDLISALERDLPPLGETA